MKGKTVEETKAESKDEEPETETQAVQEITDEEKVQE